MFGFLSAAAALFATPSDACRIGLTPNQRIADGYQRGSIAAAALVRMQRVTTADTGQRYFAAGAVEKVLLGTPPHRTVYLENGPSCDPPQPQPRRGEKWVVYFEKDVGGHHRVWAAYPLGVATLADPSLVLLSIAPD